MFCIMFKIDVLGTFQGGHYADITLGRRWDFSPKFMRHWINCISWGCAETIF